MENWTLFKEEYEKYNAAIKNFSEIEQDFTSAMFERVIEISKIIKSGTSKSEGYNDPNYIPYHLSEFTIPDINGTIYPASSYSFEYGTHINVLQISIRIDGTFRGELECSYTYSFPILEDLYQNYLTELKANMEAKHQSMEKYQEDLTQKKSQSCKKN